MATAMDRDQPLAAQEPPPGSLRAEFQRVQNIETLVLMGKHIEDLHGVDSPFLNERRSQEKIKKDRDDWLYLLRVQALIAEIEQDFEHIDALFVAIEERQDRIHVLHDRFQDLKQHMILHPDGKIDWVASGKNYELLAHDFQGDDKAAMRAMAQKVLDRDGNLRPEYQGNVPAEMIHILRQERDLRHENRQDHERAHECMKSAEEKIEQLPEGEQKDNFVKKLEGSKRIHNNSKSLETLNESDLIEDAFESGNSDDCSKPEYINPKVGNAPSPKI